MEMKRPGQPKETAARAFLRDCPNHRDRHLCSPARRAEEHERLSETDTPFLAPIGKSYREFSMKIFQYSYNCPKKVDAEIIVR